MPGSEGEEGQENVWENVRVKEKCSGEGELEFYERIEGFYERIKGGMLSSYHERVRGRILYSYQP